jgi:hypothetical protein
MGNDHVFTLRYEGTELGISPTRSDKVVKSYDYSISNIFSHIVKNSRLRNFKGEVKSRSEW